jgi:hypothetical protein
MEFHHSCSFCDSRRSSATPVMLSPNCERCGCALDAVAVPGGGSLGRVAAVALPRWAARALRFAGALLGALVLYAAAKTGYDLAGASGGMIAFGAGGFLLLPFVPEQLAS